MTTIFKYQYFTMLADDANDATQNLPSDAKVDFDHSHICGAYAGMCDCASYYTITIVTKHRIKNHSVLTDKHIVKK